MGMPMRGIGAAAVASPYGVPRLIGGDLKCHMQISDDSDHRGGLDHRVV